MTDSPLRLRAAVLRAVLRTVLRAVLRTAAIDEGREIGDLAGAFCPGVAFRPRRLARDEANNR